MKILFFSNTSEADRFANEIYANNLCKGYAISDDGNLTISVALYEPKNEEQIDEIYRSYINLTNF